MLSVIILAGGRGTRMGGVDKAQATVNGTRLIDVIFDELSAFSPHQVVVVSSRAPEVAAEVTVVSEDPPFGGPVAGIAAGANALPKEGLVAVLSVDAPASPKLLPRLIEALELNPSAKVAVIRAADGYLQPLCALWRSPVLANALSGLGECDGASVRHLLGAVEQVIEVPGDGSEQDYDTVAELNRFAQSQISGH
ncbi:molybdenum cofactor guanylyltransferase [Corynebacterium alimapuense]|uniref:Molybdenum cofactor guanylyltransferase n=1 Tax=Corynebacterium alimapuense TaxID=1576874 RepID=A0A3M8K5N0_9CORY|nr:molybdenum cofactor guanylyltransferase [Corynebacterium alimapuense]RNE48410.1 molybdenum cofactor guanylyltransferase [Corynebacterium alimapuense]